MFPCWVVDKEKSLTFGQGVYKILSDDNYVSICIYSIDHSYVIQEVSEYNWDIVKVEACGLCGTDIALFNGYLPFPYPLCIGHEIISSDITNRKYIIVLLS